MNSGKGSRQKSDLNNKLYTHKICFKNLIQLFGPYDAKNFKVPILPATCPSELCLELSFKNRTVIIECGYLLLQICFGSRYLPGGCLGCECSQ